MIEIKVTDLDLKIGDCLDYQSRFNLITGGFQAKNILKE